MLHKIMFKAVFLAVILCSSVYAGGLDHIFEKLGAEANQTGAGAFQDQATGYYTAGSLFVRQKNKAIQPINIRLPHFGANCDELSLQFGGFSHISGQEMVEMLQRVGRGVPTYALQLAMKSMVPQIEGLTSQLRTFLQQVNNTLLDDCRSKQLILDAVLPKQGAMREQLCQDMSLKGGEDWFGAKKNCEKVEKRESALNKAKEKYKDLLAGEYNLVWHVLKKMPNYKDNNDIAEFIMTLVGTIISKKEEEGYRLVYISPRGDEKEFLSTYLKGGDTSHFVCDNKEKCLNPTEKKIAIKDDKAMLARVWKSMVSLRNKYLEMGELNEEEQSFLGDAVRVPLYRYIQVSAAAGTTFMMNDTAEFIALSLLLHQFETISSEIVQAVEILEGVQMETSIIKEFKERLQLSRTRIQTMMGQSDYQAIWRLNQWIKSHEQAIVASNN